MEEAREEAEGTVSGIERFIISAITWRDLSHVNVRQYAKVVL
jgi:hypothetical protein